MSEALGKVQLSDVQMCKCADCGLIFSSDKAAVLHRTGNYTDSTRRCMTEDELEELKQKRIAAGKTDYLMKCTYGNPPMPVWELQGASI